MGHGRVYAEAGCGDEGHTASLCRYTYQCTKGKDSSSDVRSLAYKKCVSGPVGKQTMKVVISAEYLGMKRVGISYLLCLFKNCEI